ncbi:hypothetical protein L7F22_029530 [Adiantum nelumboides]|nr:hypothetical protein [Adiantum nelumboides]
MMSTKLDNGVQKLVPAHAVSETSEKKGTEAIVGVKHLPKAPNKPAKAPNKPAVDAFARFRNAGLANGKVEKDSKANNALAQRDSRPIFFRFNEGFTNAIRKPVLIRDLIC